MRGASGCRRRRTGGSRRRSASVVSASGARESEGRVGSGLPGAEHQADRSPGDLLTPRARARWRAWLTEPSRAASGPNRLDLAAAPGSFPVRALRLPDEHLTAFRKTSAAHAARPRTGECALGCRVPRSVDQRVAIPVGNISAMLTMDWRTPRPASSMFISTSGFNVKGPGESSGSGSIDTTAR